MMQHKKWIWGGLGALVVAGLFVAVPVLAAGNGNSGWMGLMSSGNMQAMHGQMQSMMAQMPAIHTRVTDQVAEQLGLTGEQLRQAMESGKGLAQLAEELGLTTDEVQTAMAEAMTVALDELVADGDLTREQADEMLSMMAGMQGACDSGMMGGQMGSMMNGQMGSMMNGQMGNMMGGSQGVSPSR